MQDNTAQGNAVYNAVKGVMGLFAGINKESGPEGQSLTPANEYTSKISDSDLIILKSQWMKDYQAYYKDIETTQETAFAYWIGKQKVDASDSIEGRDIIVNKIFEAVETFIPIATRANPEPVVTGDKTEEGQMLANDVKEGLSDLADTQKLRRKLAKMTRHWVINRIGVIEVDYDIEIDEIKTTPIQPKRMIFDKDGFIDEAGLFVGEYLGVRNKITASKLAQMFPEKKEIIMQKVNGKKGTKLEYIKWWYRGLDVFFTLDNEVLGKFKNPHWNYDGEETRINPETGAKTTELVQGKNHFKKPIAPYVFLAIFNTGLQPHDDTSLILQNISQQNQINKRYRQLDANIDSQNNGIIVDGNKMNKEQAAQAASARRRGAAIMVNGNPRDTVVLDGAPQLPSDVWRAVEKAESNLANIFGTSGSTPGSVNKEESVRGKLLINQLDSSRIGGGVTEYIEQVADTVYNLWVQMMYVHYDEPHYVNASGSKEGAEMIMLINSRFQSKLTVTVKEGSLIPKDPLTQRNEAMDLWSANAIDPLSLYKKLDFPDPAAATQGLILWQMLQKGQIQPQQYLPTFEGNTPGQLQTGEQPGTGGPAINPLNGAGPDLSQAEAGPQEGADIQSKQLMSSVPIK